MSKWEYGELYRGTGVGWVFDSNSFRKYELGVYELLDALTKLGEEGWELLLERNSNYILKRIKN